MLRPFQSSPPSPFWQPVIPDVEDVCVFFTLILLTANRDKFWKINLYKFFFFIGQNKYWPCQLLGRNADMALTGKSQKRKKWRCVFHRSVMIYSLCSHDTPFFSTIMAVHWQDHKIRQLVIIHREEVWRQIHQYIVYFALCKLCKRKRNCKIQTTTLTCLAECQRTQVCMREDVGERGKNTGSALSDLWALAFWKWPKMVNLHLEIPHWILIEFNKWKAVVVSKLKSVWRSTLCYFIHKRQLKPWPPVFFDSDSCKFYRTIRPPAWRPGFLWPETLETRTPEYVYPPTFCQNFSHKPFMFCRKMQI